jgi:diguanylate cyclase (GGDEF)-like protein/PAS domain S-box-containing protein
LKKLAKIRIILGAGLALLFGLGMAGIIQTFAWERNSLLVSGTYGMLSRIDGIAYSSKAAEEAALRFASTSDARAAAECRENLADVRVFVGGLESVQGSSPALRGMKIRLSQLLDAQYVAIRAALDGPGTAGMIQVMAARDASGSRLQLQTAMQDLRAAMLQSLDEQIATEAESSARARRLFLASGGICSILILVSLWDFGRNPGHRKTFGGKASLPDESFRQTVELATDMIFRLDERGRFTYWNPAALHLLHYDQHDVIGHPFQRFIRTEQRREVEHFYMRQNARNRKSSYHEFPVIDGQGRERWLGQSLQILTEEGRLIGFQAIARDVTERKRLESELAKSHRFLKQLTASAPGILYVFDLSERKTIFANRELAAVLGYKPEDGADFDQITTRIFHQDDFPVISAHHELLRRARDGEVHRIEYRARHSDGTWIWLSAWETPFARDADGRVTQVVGTAQDVTAHNAAREKLAWQANYDTLTRLANRRHFWTRLQGLLRRASMENIPVSLCLFDIDLFKEINDRFGHGAGAEVLEAIGAIVRSELRSEDPSGRLGGDEFCFVLPNVDQEEAAQRAERIRERLSTMAFGMNGGAPFTASATFGVAAWQPDMGARELLEAADRALYRAKASGRNCVCIDV